MVSGIFLFRSLWLANVAEAREVTISRILRVQVLQASGDGSSFLRALSPRNAQMVAGALEVTMSRLLPSNDRELRGTAAAPQWSPYPAAGPPLKLVIKAQRFKPQPELMTSRAVVAFGGQKSLKRLEGVTSTVLVMQSRIGVGYQLGIWGSGQNIQFYDFRRHHTDCRHCS